MLKLKILGLGILFLVCSVSGFAASVSLKKRSVKTEALLKSFYSLAELVRIGGFEISELCERCFGGAVKFECGAFFYDSEGLKQEDISFLEDFFSSFGILDKGGEYERTRFYTGLLEMRVKKAKEIYAERGRLYRNLGLMAGLTIFIFFL